MRYYEYIFFFSSRRRHTRWTGDWSSDVCSSDLPWPEQQRGKCRAERERVEGRGQNRNRDSDSELLVEPTGNAGDKGGWHKDRRENPRDPNDWSGALLHCFERRVLGCQSSHVLPFHAFQVEGGVV